MGALKPVAAQEVRDALVRAAQEASQACPAVDKSAVESRAQLRRIFELLGAPLPEAAEPAEPAESAGSVMPNVMMTVAEVCAITGLSKMQVHYDIKRFGIEHSLRVVGTSNYDETVIDGVGFAKMLEMRTLRNHGLNQRVLSGVSNNAA